MLGGFVDGAAVIRERRGAGRVAVALEGRASGGGGDRLAVLKRREEQECWGSTGIKAPVKRRGKEKKRERIAQQAQGFPEQEAQCAFRLTWESSGKEKT